jgi:hypothetical protein
MRPLKSPCRAEALTIFDTVFSSRETAPNFCNGAFIR